MPVRLAIGMRDLDNGTVEVARRDTKEKLNLPLADIVSSIDLLLQEFTRWGCWRGASA